MISNYAYFILFYSLQISPPFKIVEFDVLFGSGIDGFGCLVDAAELCGAIERRGSWYFKGDVKLAQGRAGAIEALKAGGNEMFQELRLKVTEAMHSKQALLLSTTSTAVGEVTDPAADEGVGYDDSDAEGTFDA